jgi:VanZ family protein
VFTATERHRYNCGSTSNSRRHNGSKISMAIQSFLKFWLPVLIWMIFIFIGSTDFLSAEHTSRFIGPFLRWLAPDVSDATIGSVQLVIRKCAHLTEYAILAALLCRALRQSRHSGAFIIAAVYAALDEIHQSFVASRTASLGDVLIDCIGAIIGVFLFGALLRRRNRKSTIEIRK